MTVTVCTTSIGKQIKTLRIARDMTLEALMGVTGIHHTWLSRIENGIVNPTPDQLAKIKAALDWPSDEAMNAAFRLLAGEPLSCQESDR